MRIRPIDSDRGLADDLELREQAPLIVGLGALVEDAGLHAQRLVRNGLLADQHAPARRLDVALRGRVLDHLHPVPLEVLAEAVAKPRPVAPPVIRATSPRKEKTSRFSRI